jgi:two-component system, NarL family, sensor histidine kinase DesK
VVGVKGANTGVDAVSADDPFDPRRSGWRAAVLPVLLAGVWLVYLVQPLQEILSHPDGVARTGGVVAIVLFSAAYVSVFFQTRRRRWSAVATGSVYQAFRFDRVSAALVAVMLVCFAAMIPSAGGSAMAAVVYIVATLMMMSPLSFGWTVSLLAVLATELAASIVPGWSDERGAGLAVLLASVAVFGMRMALRRSQQLSVARDDLARLAVQEERNRFARDLHDILGHSLTVVTMKAELAGRLVHTDPDAAEREIADVERLTREALADMRAAVTGYRGVTLAGELANARAALQAAGIEADLPTAVDEVPGERRALFGWAVREGVTNVVRHSGATRCTVTVTADAVEVLDDGRGRAQAQSASERLHAGHGLVGLGERARVLGGRVMSRSTGEGFELRVEVPPHQRSTPSAGAPPSASGRGGVGSPTEDALDGIGPVVGGATRTHR